MNGARSSPVALPRSLPTLELPGRVWSRNPAVSARLLAFTGLAAYVAAAWLGMLAHPPAGRAVLVVLTAVAGAAALAWIGIDHRLPRRATGPLAAVVALTTFALAAVAIGLPAHLILPWKWDELASDLGGGLAGLWSADYPYQGSIEWTRLAILLGLPLALGAAASLAFWPGRRASRFRRAAALVVLVVAYATAATVNPPSSPLLAGGALLLLVWAWLWLPGRTGRDALAGAALIVLAAVLALPIATSLDRGSPWIDYRSWGARASDVGPSEAFVWDQSYGPLVWPRVGQAMVEVKSDGPHYWRTAVLDQFDGSRWLQSVSGGDGAVQLPESPSAPSRLAPLNPDWIHELTYTIRGFQSDLVIGAGTPLGLPNLDGVTAMERGLVLPPDQPLEQGDSYVMRSYIPDPSPGQMRHAPRRYPATVTPDTTVTLPGGRSIDVPFWGTPASPAANRAISRSVYGGVFRIARRVTAGSTTSYDAVQAIEGYLDSHNRYSESVPARHLALRTFVLGDRRGYCQHFSGAMALMLRMVGIPARVAAGFSPGKRTSDGTYVATDFDAHAWVEAYFNGIGWVTFDPTPATAPAHSRTSGLGAPVHSTSSESSQAAPSETDAARRPTSGEHPAGDTTGASFSWLPRMILIVVVSILIGGGGVALWERLRRRVTRPRGGVDVQLAEVVSALERVRRWRTGGSTLLALERRLAAEVGPGSAAYVERIRAALYRPGSNAPPTPSERRILRRELTARLGLRARLLGLLAIPPGGPAGGGCKPPFRSAS